jgi:predicted PurR-regulated permease PerM
VHLDGPDAGEANGRRPPLGDAVRDEELVARHDEDGAVPAPDSGESMNRGQAEQKRADEPERRGGSDDEDQADNRREQGLPERPHERSRMRPLLQADPLAGLEVAPAHAEEFSAGAWKPRSAGTIYGKNPGMKDTALKAFVAALIVVAVVALALALWKLRIVIALIFLAFIIAAAMRPSVEWLRRYRVPRGVGIIAHYAVLIGVLALLLWAVVPRAIDQVDKALGGIPTSSSELQQETEGSTGVKHEILIRVQDALDELPSGRDLLDPALSVTFTVFEVFVGIFFTLACAAYWIFERERAENLVLSLLPRERRRVVRDTWNLIDLKLGAYVRGTLILVFFVASLLSLIFYLIGLPFWLLIAVFAGFVEVVPVIGPLVAGALAVGVGFTESWELALAAGLAVLGVRLLEDYIVIPRVLGTAVGLTPLSVLIAVAAMTFLFGGFAVLLAIPVAAVLATLVDVVVRHRNPAEEDVPAVLFPAKEAEEGR